MRLVFASNNAGKIREVAKILAECFEEEITLLFCICDVYAGKMFVYELLCRCR